MEGDTKWMYDRKKTVAVTGPRSIGIPNPISNIRTSYVCRLNRASSTSWVIKHSFRSVRPFSFKNSEYSIHPCSFPFYFSNLCGNPSQNPSYCYTATFDLVEWIQLQEHPRKWSEISQDEYVMVPLQCNENEQVLAGVCVVLRCRRAADGVAQTIMLSTCIHHIILPSLLYKFIVEREARIYPQTAPHVLRSRGI